MALKLGIRGLSLTPNCGIRSFVARHLAQATAGQAQLNLPGEELYKQDVQDSDTNVPLISIKSL